MVFLPISSQTTACHLSIHLPPILWEPILLHCSMQGFTTKHLRICETALRDACFSSQAAFLGRSRKPKRKYLCLKEYVIRYYIIYSFNINIYIYSWFYIYIHTNDNPDGDFYPGTGEGIKTTDSSNPTLRSPATIGPRCSCAQLQETMLLS